MPAKSVQKRSLPEPAPGEKPSLCQKCDMQFMTWDLLHEHKLSSPNHITCKICSMDFTTKAACERHRLQNHAAAQNLRCPTCRTKFSRLGSLINHMEFDQCAPTLPNGMKFHEKFKEREMHYNNRRNISQLYEFGQTSGNFDTQSENRERQPIDTLTSNESERGSVRLDGASESRPSSHLSQRPVFNFSYPTLHPDRFQPLVDILADDAIPEADEDLISFDACHDSFLAEEILNAPLTMKPEEIKVKALFKANAFIAKKEKDSKSDTFSVGTVVAPKPEKPAAAIQTAKVINPMEFPMLTSQHKPKEKAQPKGPATIEPVAVVSSVNAWGTKKNLFPHAAAAPATTGPSVATSAPISSPPLIQMVKSLGIAEPEGTKFAPHDPSDPNFNIGKYWISFIGKYKCPYPPGCMKTFPTAGAFLGHLRSPAHSGGRFRCRNCLRFFTTAGALTQHSESQGTRCIVRETVQYDMCVDEFTAGTATVAGKLHDNTIRYGVIIKLAVDQPIIDQPTVNGKNNREQMQARHDAGNDARDVDQGTFWQRYEPMW